MIRVSDVSLVSAMKPNTCHSSINVSEDSSSPSRGSAELLSVPRQDCWAQHPQGSGQDSRNSFVTCLHFPNFASRTFLWTLMRATFSYGLSLPAPVPLQKGLSSQTHNRVVATSPQHRAHSVCFPYVIRGFSPLVRATVWMMMKHSRMQGVALGGGWSLCRETRPQ